MFHGAYQGPYTCPGQKNDHVEFSRNQSGGKIECLRRLERDFAHSGRNGGHASVGGDQFRHFLCVPALQSQHAQTIETHASHPLPLRVSVCLHIAESGPNAIINGRRRTLDQTRERSEVMLWSLLNFTHSGISCARLRESFR